MLTLTLLRQHPLLVALGLALIVAGAMCAYVMIRSARLAVSELHPPRNRPRQPGESHLAGLHEVSYTASDGVTLSAWYVPSRNGAAVLLGHGFGANRETMLPEARMLAGAGFGVLLADWRAHGASGGGQCTWGDLERRDVGAALDFLATRPEVQAKRIGALGVSLGGVALVLAAARDQRLSAVAVEAVWTSLADEARLDMPRLGWISAWPQLAVFRSAGIDIDAIRPVDAVGAIAPRPLLLMYGGQDSWLPPEMRERIAAAAPSAEFWLVPEAAHGGCRDAWPDEHRRRILAFFERALCDGCAPREAACPAPHG